jgi:AcrR family transcriptional regulator
MSKDVSQDWRRGGNGGAESRYESRQGLIAKAARVCFERKGVGKTSIADITREAQITRELFYYYFPNKRAAVDAVLESFVNDAHDLVWQVPGAQEAAGESEVQSNETAVDAPADQEASTALAQENLAFIVSALREWLATDADATLPMTEILREIGSLSQVMNRVATDAVAALCKSVALSETANTDTLRLALEGTMVEQLAQPELTNEQLSQSLFCLL